MSSYESNRKNLRRLRKILAYLYEDIESAERIVSDAGLDITTIRWNKTPMNCWYEILKNAEKHEKVEAVVSIALEEFEENAELQEAWRLYQADGQQTLEETKHKTNNERYKEWQITLNWKDRGKPRLREFDLANRDLSDLSLIEVDLKKANLSYTNLKNTNLSRADLCEVNLCGADLSGASLVEAKLLRANLSGAKLYNVNLSGAKLQGANLSYANLFKAYLEGADLRMAILHRARIDTTTQLHAKWRLVWEIIHQEIRHPDIREANLIKKNSFGDTITGNYLSGADLSEANLSYSDLSGDNLKGANLEGANLSCANLFMAYLEGANLKGANLEGAKLLGITYDSTTQWPSGFIPQIADTFSMEEVPVKGKAIQIKYEDLPF